MATKKEFEEQILTGLLFSGINDIKTYSSLTEKQVNGAVRSIARNRIDTSDIVLLLDDTVFGSASTGMVFTNDALYIKQDFVDHLSCRYDEIRRVKVIEGLIFDDIEITLDSGSSFKFYFAKIKEVNTFAYWLNGIAEMAHNLEEEYQDLDEEVDDESENEDSDDIANEEANTSQALVKQPPVKPTLAEGLTPDLFTLLTKEYKYGLDAGCCFVAPDIPVSKLNGAIEGIAQNNLKPNEVLLVGDDTVFGSATDGIILTRDAIYARTFLGDNIKIKFTDIDNVFMLGDSDDSKREIRVLLKSGNTVDFPNFTSLYKGNTQRFGLWLYSVGQIAQYEVELAEYKGIDHESLNTSNTLEDMPTHIQFKFMQVISNFVLADGDAISPQEAGVIYILLSKLRLSSEDRYKLREYQADATNLIPTETLIKDITSSLDSIATQNVINSLIKEMVNIYLNAHYSVAIYNGSTGDNSAEDDESYLDNDFIMNFAESNGVSREQVQAIKQVIVAEYKIYNDNVDDAGLNTYITEAAAKLGAVGLPIAVLYFSGSVVGLSAVGITSGLAALGLGGILGFSSMVTGIGALILIGIGVHQGIKMLGDQGARDKRARKQAMLFEVNRRLTKTINLLVEDINTFTQILTFQLRKVQALELDVFEKEQVLQDLLDQLDGLSALSMGNELMVCNNHMVEAKANLQTVPLVLDIDRLRAITDEPTTRVLRDEVLKLYEFNSSNQTYRLRSDLNYEEAIFLSQVFDKLDYFSVGATIKSYL